MRAITVSPGVANSARLEDVADPPLSDGSILVVPWRSASAAPTSRSSRATTARARPATDVWSSGTRSLGRVVDAPADSGLAPGDLVVGIVRRPDPVPCPACAVGEWDMCRNGRYTERGINGRNGYASRSLPDRARLRGQARSRTRSRRGAGGADERRRQGVGAYRPHRRALARLASENRVVAVTGAGPVGLLAALLGVQRGFEVHVSTSRPRGRSPGWSPSSAHLPLDGRRRRARVLPDVTVECTGVPEVIRVSWARTTPATRSRA